MFDLKEYDKQRYEKNKERILKRVKKYYEENRENILKKQSKYQKNNRKKINMNKRKNRKKRYEMKRKYVASYKVSKGCSVCGYNKYVGALDFHHRSKRDKEFVISQFIDTKSLKKIKEEMEKCDILCANCHRGEHAGDPAIY